MEQVPPHTFLLALLRRLCSVRVVRVYLRQVLSNERLWQRSLTWPHPLNKLVPKLLLRAYKAFLGWSVSGDDMSDDTPTRPPGANHVGESVAAFEATLRQLGVLHGPMPIEIERAFVHHLAQATDRGLSAQAKQLWDAKHEVDRRVDQVRKLMLENRDLRLMVMELENAKRK